MVVGSRSRHVNPPVGLLGSCCDDHVGYVLVQRIYSLPNLRHLKQLERYKPVVAVLSGLPVVRVVLEEQW